MAGAGQGNLINDFSRLGVADEGVWTLDETSNAEYGLSHVSVRLCAADGRIRAGADTGGRKVSLKGRPPVLV